MSDHPSTRSPHGFEPRRRGIDPEIGIALLLSPMICRHVFVSKSGGKGPKDLEIRVADAFLAAFGTEKCKPPRG